MGSSSSVSVNKAKLYGVDPVFYDIVNGCNSEEESCINSNYEINATSVNEEEINLELNEKKDTYYSNITDLKFQKNIPIKLNEINKLENSNDNKISYLRSDQGNIIRTIEIIPTNTTNTTNTYIDTNKVIIYSHENRDNIFIVKPLIKIFAENCSAVVISYDYIGYSNENNNQSKFPSEDGAYESITTVINYALKKFTNKKILLMGYSFGTGVVIDYVKKNNWHNPIVLFACFKSILTTKIIHKSIESAESDRSDGSNDSGEQNDLKKSILREVLFDNINKINSVQCPILFIHGKNDEIVNYKHTEELFDQLTNKTFQPKYLANADHETVINKSTPEILNNLFLYMSSQF